MSRKLVCKMRSKRCPVSRRVSVGGEGIQYPGIIEIHVHVYVPMYLCTYVHLNGRVVGKVRRPCNPGGYLDVPQAFLYA